MGASKRTSPTAAASPQGAAAKAGSGNNTGGQQGRGGGEQRSCLTSQLRKTKICVYHLKGACQYGNSCAFAHSCTELQSIPDLRKTRLCLAFERGGCNDRDCTFAHGEDELRSTNLFYKKTLCIWNQKGKCRNGDQCRFAHGTAELRTNGGQWNAGSSRAAPTGKQAARDKRMMAVAKGEEAAVKEPMQEPMKVQPAVCLTASGPQVGMPVPAMAGYPNEVKDAGQGVPPPPPGLRYTGAMADSYLPNALESVQSWHWPQGLGMEYDAAPSQKMPANMSAANAKEMKAAMANLMRLRADLEQKELQQDLLLLRRGVAGLTQKVNEISMQVQVQNTAAKSSKVVPDAYYPGTYLKTATDFGLDGLEQMKAGRYSLMPRETTASAYWA